MADQQIFRTIREQVVDRLRDDVINQVFKPGENLREFVLAERYGCPVGLSDHTGTIWPGLAAFHTGARMLELHVTMSREMFGPDVVASLTTAEFGQLTAGVRFIERMRSHPVDKTAAPEAARPLREIFMKSVVARRDLPAGTVLRTEHLTAKKPGTGIPASELPSLVDRRLCRAVQADVPIVVEDLEPAER